MYRNLEDTAKRRRRQANAAPHGPEVTSREAAIADSLAPSVRERIRAEAEEAAAELMERFERTRGLR